MSDTFTTRSGRTFHGSPATLWVCYENGEVIVTGDARSVEPPSTTEDDGHNCDMAGCLRDHVLAHGRVVGVPALSGK